MIDTLLQVIEWIILHPISSILILLVEYIVIMVLYHRTNKTGAKIAKVLAIPFVIQDALVNWFALTPLFLEFPQETLVTSRLKRWKKLPADSRHIKKLRRRFAISMCRILDKYDAGHCGD